MALREASHERAAHSRGAVERAAAAERRSLFRALGTRTGQAARRRATIAAPSPGFDGVEIAYLSAAEITTQLAPARCISASPARTWCAK